MPTKCRRCGNYHMQGNCDDGYDCYSFKPYPKWRLVWRRIYKFLWRYFKVDFSMLFYKPDGSRKARQNRLKAILTYKS